MIYRFTKIVRFSGIFGLSKISYLFTQCDYLLNEEIEPNTAIADGDVIKWWCDQLPRGLYFDIDDGTIYGRPQVIMSTHITIYASDDVDTIITGAPSIFSYTENGIIYVSLNRYFYIPLISDIALPSLDISASTPGMHFDKKTGTISGKFKSILNSAVYTVVGQDFYDKYKTQVIINTLNETVDVPGIALNQFSSEHVIGRITESFIGRVVYHQHILDKVLINSTQTPDMYDFEINSVYMEFYFVNKADLVITFRLNGTGGAILYLDNISNPILKIEGSVLRSENVTVVMFAGYNFMKLDYSGMSYSESYISLEYCLRGSNEFKIVSKDETIIYSLKPGFLRYQKIEVAENTYVCNFPSIINGFATHYSIYPPNLPPGLVFSNITGRIMGKTEKEVKSLTYYTVTAHSIFGSSKTSFYISVINRIHEGVLKIIRTLTGHYTDLNMFHLNNRYFVGYDKFTGCKFHELYPRELDNAVQISSVTMIEIQNEANIHKVCVTGRFMEVRMEINCTTYIFGYNGHCQDINFMNDCFYQTTILEYFDNMNEHDTVYFYFIGDNFTFVNPFYYSAKHIFYYEISNVKLYKSNVINIAPVYDFDEMPYPDYFVTLNDFPLGIGLDNRTGRIFGINMDDSRQEESVKIIASYYNQSIVSRAYTITFSSDKLSAVFQIHYMDKYSRIVRSIVFMQYSNISEETQPYIFGYVTACNVEPELPSGMYLNTQCKLVGIPYELQSSKVYNITASNIQGGKSTQLRIGVERCQHVTAVNISVNNPEVLFESDIMINIINVSPSIIDYFSFYKPYRVFCLADGVKNIVFDILNFKYSNITHVDLTLKFTNDVMIKKITLYDRVTTEDIYILNPPAELYYDPSDITLQVGLLPRAIPAHYINTATLFLSQPTFPAEIYLNTKGEIVGVPMKVMNKTGYIIVACNENDCTTTNITLTIEAYGCYPVESYPAVKLGYAAYINCGYNMYGNRSRICHRDVDGSPTWTGEIEMCMKSPTEPSSDYLLVTYSIKIDISPSYFTLYHQHNLNYKLRNISSIPIFYFTYKTVRPSSDIDDGIENDYATEIVFQFSVFTRYKSSIISSTNQLINSDDFWVYVFEEKHTFTILSSDINEYILEKDYSVICIISFSVLGFIIVVAGIVIFCKKTHRLHNVNPRFEIEYYLPFVNSGNVAAMSPSSKSNNSFTNMNNVHSTTSSPSRTHLIHSLRSGSMESEEGETIVQI